MKKLERELNEVIESNKSYLAFFIKKKLKSKLFGKQNQQELIRLLPLIIENTNEYNYEWIKEYKFINDSNFWLVLFQNMDKFNFDDSNTSIDMITMILDLIRIFDLSETELDILVDKLPSVVWDINYFHLENLYTILKKYSLDAAYCMLEKYIVNDKTVDSCLSFLLTKNIYFNLIFDNIDYILENCKSLGLFSLNKIKDEAKDNPSVISKIDAKIKEDEKRLLSVSLDDIYDSFLNYEEKRTISKSRDGNQDNQDNHHNNAENKVASEKQVKLDSVLEILYLIISDICKNEKVEIKDIKELGSGTYSSVIEIGHKVIKIGKTRVTKKFPNNPYINSVLLRKEFPITDGLSLFVEVSEKLDTESLVSEEELYNLYKHLRDIGLIWTDIAKRNVGRLEKDNVVHWKEELPLTDERLGLDTYRGEKNVTLKKGEIVLLDSDFIFDENAPNIKECQSFYYTKFKERYDNEKRKREREAQSNLSQGKSDLGEGDYKDTEQSEELPTKSGRRK